MYGPKVPLRISLESATWYFYHTKTMLPNLSSTITRSRSLLQSTSSARQPCFPRHITRPSLLPLLPHHPPSFSTSNPRLSRGSKSNKAKQSAESPSSPLPFGSSSTTGSSGNLPGGSPAPDPFDFSLLDAAHERLVTKLQTDLGKLKPGGLSLDAVEGVRVELTGTDGLITAKGKGREKEKEKGGRVRVGDIAQVLVRGRICVVLVGEKEVCSFSYLFCLISLDDYTSSGELYTFPSRPFPPLNHLFIHYATFHEENTYHKS